VLSHLETSHLPMRSWRRRACLLCWPALRTALGSLGSLELHLINGVRPLSWGALALVLDRSKGPNLDLWLEPKDGRALACGLNRKDGRALFMNLKCKKDLYSLSLLDSTR